MDKHQENLHNAILSGKKRNYTRAITLLTDIVCNTDNYPIALLYLGRSYHAVNQFDKAVYILEYYLSINPQSAAGNLFCGRSYLALGLYKKAISKLKKAISSNPDLYVTFSFLGLAYLKLKKPEIALQYFEDALKLAPDNVNVFNGYLNALLIKAIKYFYKKYFTDSIQMFEFILKYRKDSFLPHLYLARIYKELGNFQKSLLHYNITCDLAPDDSVLKLQKALILMRIGKRDEAFGELKHNPLFLNSPSLNSITPNTITPIMLQKFTSLTYFQNKQYKKAIYYGKKILKENYRDNEIHAIIAESYRNLGELEKAKNHYYRCLEIRYNYEIHYIVLQILWELKNYNNLLKEVKRIIQSDPANKIAGYFYALALVYSDAAPEQIIQTLQKQIKIFGPDPQLMSTMGLVYYKYDFPELAENWLIRTLKIVNDDEISLKTLIKVLQILNKNKELTKYYEIYFMYYPEDWLIKKDYIKLLISQKNYLKAITELNNLIPYEKNNKVLKKMLITCYINTKKYEDAIVSIKVLLKEKPESIDLLQTLIYCLEKTNRRTIAINLLENAKMFFKDNSSILFSLGILYFKEKNYEKALQIFRNLLSETPNNWKIYRSLGVIYQKMGNSVFAEKFFHRAHKYKKG